MSDSNIDLGLLRYLAFNTDTHIPTGLPLPNENTTSICQYLCELFNKDGEGLKFNDDIRAPFELREQPARGTAPNGRGRARGIPPWPQIAPYAPGAPCPCQPPASVEQELPFFLPEYLRDLEQWWPETPARWWIEEDQSVPRHMRWNTGHIYTRHQTPGELFCKELERRFFHRNVLYLKRYLDLLKRLREERLFFQPLSDREKARRWLRWVQGSGFLENYWVQQDIRWGNTCVDAGKAIATMMQNCNELGYDFTNCKWDEDGPVLDADQWFRNRGFEPPPKDVQFETGNIGHPDFYPPNP